MSRGRAGLGLFATRTHHARETCETGDPLYIAKDPFDWECAGLPLALSTSLEAVVSEGGRETARLLSMSTASSVPMSPSTLSRSPISSATLPGSSVVVVTVVVVAVVVVGVITWPGHTRHTSTSVSRGSRPAVHQSVGGWVL